MLEMALRADCVSFSSFLVDSRVTRLRYSNLQRLSGNGYDMMATCGRSGLFCRQMCIRASQITGQESPAIPGMVFQPFSEFDDPQFQVTDSPLQSLARHRYVNAAEAAVNDQINVEYSVSYIYHAMFAYFDRDIVGLPGIAKFFKEASEDEREDAELLMEYQNARGGNVVLRSIMTPVALQLDQHEKGEALSAMELSLSLAKLVNEKLLAFCKVAEDNQDPQMRHFIQTHFLKKQVARIKKIAEYVSQLRRIGKGHAVYHFDQVLQGEAEEDVILELC